MSAFYSTQLTKKGPLGRIWIVSTLGDRKLSKAQLLSTSIIKSIEAIVNAERKATAAVEADESEDEEQQVAAVPMALRLSGQLLLGVARIYSRKAKYLVDDCNEALLKIRMTFRTGAGSTSVDMAADQTRASKNSITRQDDVNEFDLLYADLATYPVAAPPKKTSKKVAQAKDSDITLPDTDFDLIGNKYAYADNELSGVIDSQVYLGDETFDLGFDENAFGDDLDATPTKVGKKRARKEADREDDDISVELGRDAPHSSARKSARLASDPVNHDADLEFSHDLGGGADITFDDMNFGGQEIEFDLDFGTAPPADGMQTPRAGSPTAASAPPESVEVTPRTAAQINAKAQQQTKKKTSRTKAQPKQIIDEVTELQANQSAVASPARRRNDQGESQSQSLARSGADGRADRLKMGIIAEAPQYLPRSALHMRFLEIENDPAAYYLPRVGEKQDQLYMGPPGIAPELQELFVIPLDGRRKRLQTDTSDSASKRAREDGDLSVELGRRAPSLAPSLNFDQSAMGAGNDLDANLFDDLGAGPVDDSFQFDLDGAAPREATPVKGGLSVPLRGQSSRLSTPAPAKASQGPLRVFDVEPPRSVSRSGSRRSITPAPSSQQQTPSKSSVINGEHGSGWSKNTLKAVQVIGDALNEDEGTEQKCSFEQVSGKAAAAFFFECLVLGTRDRIKLSQGEPYGDIDISPKDRFFELGATAAQSSPIAAR